MLGHWVCLMFKSEQSVLAINLPLFMEIASLMSHGPAQLVCTLALLNDLVALHVASSLRVILAQAYLP